MELEDLASTLGLRLLGSVVQVRRDPHPGTYFGKGKVEDLTGWVKELLEGEIPADWDWYGDHWEPAPEPQHGPVGDPMVSSGEGEASDEGRRTGQSAKDADQPGEDTSQVGGDPFSSNGGLKQAEGGDEGGTQQAARAAGRQAQEAERDDGEGTKDADRRHGRGTHEERRADKEADRRHGRGTHEERRADEEETKEAERGHGAATQEEDLGEGGLQRAPEGIDAGYDPDHDPPLLLVLNDDVKPSVLFNLEEHLGVEVWDRTRLILEIFSLHANVKEARLQVELAKLEYEVPLIREAVHRQRAGERPGFMGGGEYGVADYQDFIKRRMGTVQKELDHIRKERTVRRQVRREGFYLVSLAGYTNAGKSSLLNALTGAETLSRGTLFSTLETTTRKLRWGGASEIESGAGDRETAPGSTYTRPILLTDTVGFIQALPSWLLEAFHSTLEEISVSDVVLLIADVSDQVDVMLDKIRVCRDELSFLDVECPVLVVLNKVDLVPERAVAAKRRAIVGKGLADDRAIVEVSSVNGVGLGDLVTAIDRDLPEMIPYQASLPMDQEGQRILSRLHEWGPIASRSFGATIGIEGRCDPIHWKLLGKAIANSAVRLERL